MGVLTDKDINRKLNYNDIAIWPHDAKLITGLGYDLSIGILVPLSHHDKFTEDEDYYYLPPNCYCLIITKELVWISKNLVGTLHARGTLAARGLFTSATNVDPNFQGQMIMSVKNLSSKVFKLEKKESFITLIFHTVTTPTQMLVGNEGSKKSMRVISYLLENVYTDTSSTFDKNCRASLDKLSNYFTISTTECDVKFNSIIHECKNPFKRIKKSFKNYKERFKVLDWTRSILSLGAWALLAYVFLDYSIFLINADEITFEESKGILLASAALVALASNLNAKR